MKKRILITGPSGSVGSEVIENLLHRGDYDIRGFDIPTRRSKKVLKKYLSSISMFWGDITNRGDLESALEGVDAVIHLAAVIPPMADEYPELAESVNIKGTRNLVKVLEDINPGCRFIYSSSISVYGDRVKDPWISMGDPLKPSEGDFYAHTKIAGENIVASSGLNWSIFRFTGIMNPKIIKMDPLMFHMPLDTSFEIMTARDTAEAVVRAVQCSQAEKGIFNLGGGINCRTSYREYISRHFDIIGLGRNLLPDEAFAERNFHCGFYKDSPQVLEMLGLTPVSLEDYFEEIEARTHRVSKWINRIMRRIIKKYLLRHSDPLLAIKNNNPILINRYFYNVSKC